MKEWDKLLFLPLLNTDTISSEKTRLTREEEGVTEHLLLPGVDTVEEIILQVHQDVVTYIKKKSHTVSVPVSILQAFLGLNTDKHIHPYLCAYVSI